jgi:cytochrome c553
VHRKQLQHLLIGAAIAGLVIVPVIALTFVKSGLFNVGASSPHTKFTEWITHETMIHSVVRHATSIDARSRFTPQQIVAGFCTYETHCVACHGASAVAREQWVSGLEPSPPYLLDATSRWKPRELFWIAKNGIKMTGMPSWRDSLGDDQIWDVVGFLEAMRRLPPQTYVSWRAQGRCRAATSQTAPGPLSIRRP